ncbi:MAG: hypothetical protein V4631_17195 [Pseudomonadota bacterium]
MSLHPDFPVVSGAYALTKDWTLTLPVQFNRRIEDGSMVLWMPELTFWINIWNNDARVPPEDQLVRLLNDADPARSDEQIERGDALLRLSYELADDEPDGRAISAHVISQTGYVQLSVHYDSPEARSMAYAIIHSLKGHQ